MPDIETREGRWRPFTHWESLWVQISRNTGVAWLRFTSLPSWQLPAPKRHGQIGGGSSR